MKIKTGDTVLMLPPNGQILGVVAFAEESDGSRRKNLVELVYLDTIKEMERRSPDVRGRPTIACVCGLQLKFWPPADRDMELLIRYYPPEVEQ